MHLPSYRIVEISDRHSVFRFISKGLKGEITKLIIFTEFNSNKKIYNLALVDIISDGEISDTNISNNGDIGKILATVAQVTIDYTLTYPERTIYFQGSDKEGKRISVYNAAIRKYYYLLEKDFYIQGYISDLVKEKFNPLRKYEGFLVKRK